MYKLYYSPGACSMAVHVILNELDVPFEPIRTVLSEGQAKTPEFLKLNPRGQVPLLVEENTPIKEGAAIITYLLDKHSSPLLPKSGLARAKALEWLMWGNSSLHPACSRLFWLKKQSFDEKTTAEISKLFMAQVQALWDEAETRLATTKYLAGETITAGDILLAVIANWGVGTPGPNVKRVLKEVVARPAYQKALKTEQVEYKAAA